VHFRKTSNALDASVQSEQYMCFQKSAEAVSVYVLPGNEFKVLIESTIIIKC